MGNFFNFIKLHFFFNIVESKLNKVKYAVLSIKCVTMFRISLLQNFSITKRLFYKNFKKWNFWVIIFNPLYLNFKKSTHTQAHTEFLLFFLLMFELAAHIHRMMSRETGDIYTLATQQGSWSEWFKMLSRSSICD